MNKFPVSHAAILIGLLVQALSATINWTTKTAMPTGRDGLGIGVVRDTVYCIGGWTAGSPGSATGACEAYVPATGSWVTRAPMPTPRGFLGICVANNKIYAIGGWNGSSSTLTTVEEYDPSTDTWQPKASMTVGRCGLGAESVNGNVYAIGGFYTSTVEEFDPAVNAWVAKTAMPQARGFFASEVSGGKVYVMAGRGNAGNIGPTYEYDRSADTSGGNPWLEKADIPTLRYHPEAGTVSGKLYVCGGLGSTGEVATVEAYDPTGNTWQNETPMNVPRRELDVGVVGYRLYAIGGWPSGVSNVNEEGEVVALVQEHSPTRPQPRLDQNMPNPFRYRTTIRYVLPSQSRVAVKVFNLAGAHVATLFEGIAGSGAHSLSWSGQDGLGRDVPSGVYFCRLITHDRTEVIRLTTVR